MNQPTANPARPRVLLVEDHPEVARATIEMLDIIGCPVTLTGTRHSAEAAVETGEPFDLVLIDYSLPDGTGVDLLKRLRKRGPVRAILITAHTKNMILHGDEAGFVQYLAKPVEIEELRAAVESAMRATL